MTRSKRESWRSQVSGRRRFVALNSDLWFKKKIIRIHRHTLLTADRLNCYRKKVVEDATGSGKEEGGRKKSDHPHIFPRLLVGAGRLSAATWRPPLPELEAGWWTRKPGFVVGVTCFGLAKWGRSSCSCFNLRGLVQTLISCLFSWENWKERKNELALVWNAYRSLPGASPLVLGGERKWQKFN